MPFRTTLNMIGGAVNTVTEFYEDVVETVREVTPEPIIQATDYVSDLLEKGFAASPMGIAERGAAVAGKEVTKATGSPLVGGAVEVGLGVLIPGGSAPAPKPLIKGATPIVQQAARTAGPTPPMGPQTPALAGAGPQITMRGGSVSLQPPTVMKAVTATDAPTLAGVRGGVQTGADLVSGAQGKRLIKRDLDIEGYRNTIETKVNEMKALRELRGDPKRLKEFVNNASPELQAYWKAEKGNIDKIISRLDGNKKNAQEGLSRAQSNVLPFDTTKRAAEIGSSENVNYFRSKVGLTAKKAEESARAVQGYLEQHHLFPKGMSAAFFGKMDELISKGKATKDDLILMAEFTANQGRRTGDVKANLINMAKDPHNELHTILRAQGAELKKSDYVRMLENVDNVDDLLVKWRELLSGDAAYNIETAKIWEPLDDLLKEIQK